MSVLEVRELCIRYPGMARPVVSNLNFSIAAGESVGLVGESGAGKSQTALAILGLLPKEARISGSVCYAGRELIGAGHRVLNTLRGRRIAMVFQDAATALNPYLRIGEQLRRILLQHSQATGTEIKQRIIRMLRKMDLPDAERQFEAYPHQLSGGMRQRVMIAAALITEPELLIADEPTTAIDATIQAQILSLLRALRKEIGTGLLLITHDLGVVAENCERMLVLDDGRILQQGSTQEVFANPIDARTRAMLETADERPPETSAALATEIMPAIDVTELCVKYRERRTDRFWASIERVAVQATSMVVRPGETVAIVGESGSGKTSLAHAILGLVRPANGSVCLFGREIPCLLESRHNVDRRKLQLVFQDPLVSLNPAMRVHEAIAEPLRVHESKLGKEERDSRVLRMLGRVGLDKELLGRFPHELSGGQAQRVAIARVLILEPAILICDEAVASLDRSTRRGILQVLSEEQQRSALAIIFISHDLDVVRQISHRVLVMYMGRIIEETDSKTLFSNPRHPYSRALIDCIPVADPNRTPVQPTAAGEAPSMLNPPTGCVFHPRCQHAIDRCRTEAPRRERVVETWVACHRATELNLAAELQRL